MAKEIDDDVPIYFSPGEELSEEELAQHAADRKSLLQDEPPAAWERYSPAKTLEQAAVEAETRGEKKIKGIKNRPSKSGVLQDAGSSLQDKPELSKVEAPAEQHEQSMTLDRFLKLSGRFLKPNLIKLPDAPQEGADGEPQSQPSDSVSRAHGRQSRALFLVACVNVFAIGFWSGSFLFPNNKIVTSLRIEDPKQIASDGTGPRMRGDTSVADVAAGMNPIVVNIDTRFRRPSFPVVQPLQATTQFFQPPAGSVPMPPKNYTGHSQGSGVIVSTSGHILTSNHVVPPGTEIRVTLYDKREFQGVVVGRDSYSDLAVIKINSSGLPVPRWADVKKVRPGDWAIVIGSPHGFDHSVTVGVVSSLDRVVSDFNHHIPLIQTDANIGPGNSGGPVVNIDGEIIGICAAAANMGTVGINFALPADTASQVAKKLMEEGSIPRPFLGIYMEDLDPDKKKAHTLPGNPVMVMVKGVVPKGPAAKAGIMREDIIVKVNGKSVRSSTEVRAILSSLKPGDTMDFEVRRRMDATQVKRVILEKYPDNY